MLNGKIRATLAATPLGQYLEPHELEMLMTYVKTITFSPDEIILQQGVYCDGLYIITEGLALLTARTLGSDATNIATLKKGDFIGEINLLIHEPSSMSIIATTQVKCILISNVYLDFLSAFFPDEKYKIILAIAKQICDRIKITHTKIVSFIDKSSMTSQPIVGRMIESLKKPTPISYEEAEIDLDKLHSMETFSIFNREEYAKLLKSAKLIKAAKHCSLIKEEESHSGCFIVLRGAVQSSIVYNNIVAKLSVIGPVLLFSSVSAVDPTSPSTVSYTTCEQAILLSFSQSELESIQRNNKLLWDKLFGLICKSLVALEKSVQKLDIRLNIELYNR